MALTASRLQVEAGYEDKGADRGLDNLDKKVKSSARSMRDMTKASHQVGRGLEVLGVGAIAVGAGMAAMFAATAGPAMEFEKTMSGVKAVSAATGEEFKQLSGLALQLGKDTVFSATQAAQGIEELVKGGISIQDVLGGAAAAALNLASAGAVPLTVASEQLADAMNIFGLKGTQAAHVADLIAGSANASSMTVTDFGFAMKMAGAVAKISGQDIDSTATAISVLAQAGLKGSDAGTSLKTMLLNLQPTTKNQIAMFKELGLITADNNNLFVDAAGKMKPLAEISQILQEHTKDLTAAAKTQALEIAFGTDAIRAAAIMSEAGAAGFAKMTEEMSKVSALDVAKERLNNLAGDMEQMKGSAETLAIMIGGQFSDVLRDGAKWLTDLLNAGIDSFGGIQAHADALLADGLAANKWEATLFAIAASLKVNFGPETANLFEAFTNQVDGAKKMMENFFKSTKEGGPGWVEAISSHFNHVGKDIDFWLDLLARAIIGVEFFRRRVVEIFGNMATTVGGFFSKLGSAITSTFPGFSKMAQDLGASMIKLGADTVHAMQVVSTEAPMFGPTVEEGQGVLRANEQIANWQTWRDNQDAAIAAAAAHVDESASTIGDGVGPAVAASIGRSLNVAPSAGHQVKEHIEKSKPEALYAIDGFMSELNTSAGTFAVDFGSTGGALASALASALVDDTPQTGQALGRALQKMVTDLGTAGVADWQQLGDDLAAAVHTAMVAPSEEATLAVHALIIENVGLIQSAKEAAKAEADAAKEAERMAAELAKAWKPGEGFARAFTEVAQNDSMVAAFGEAGASAKSAFTAAWDGDHNSEAKAANAIQRMIAEGRRAGMADAGEAGGAIFDALRMALQNGDEGLRDIGLAALEAFGARIEAAKVQAESFKDDLKKMVEDGLADMKRLQDAEGAKIDLGRERDKIDRDLARKQAEIRSKGGPNMGTELAAASAQAATAKSELAIRAQQQTEDRDRKARNDAALAAEAARLKGTGTTRSMLPPGVTIGTIGPAPTIGTIGPAAEPPEPSQDAKDDAIRNLLRERPIEITLEIDGEAVEAVVTRRRANGARSRVAV